MTQDCYREADGFLSVRERDRLGSMRSALLGCLIAASLAAAARGQGETPPPGGKMPHLEVDVKKKQVRVECEALNVEMPLEFFCCVTGTNEHESVLRSAVKPSHLHLALLMIGLKPGEPV